MRYVSYLRASDLLPFGDSPLFVLLLLALAMVDASCAQRKPCGSPHDVFITVDLPASIAALDAEMKSGVSGMKRSNLMLIDRLDSIQKGDVSLLFPYVPIDSVQLTELPQTTARRSYARLLDRTEETLLVSILSNPTHYLWGECGTPIPEFKFAFYSCGDIVAYVVLACDRGQVVCSPTNPLVKHGALSAEGSALISQLLHP